MSDNVGSHILSALPPQVCTDKLVARVLVLVDYSQPGFEANASLDEVAAGLGLGYFLVQLLVDSATAYSNVAIVVQFRGGFLLLATHGQSCKLVDIAVHNVEGVFGYFASCLRFAVYHVGHHYAAPGAHQAVEVGRHDLLRELQGLGRDEVVLARSEFVEPPHTSL